MSGHRIKRFRMFDAEAELMARASAISDDDRVEEENFLSTDEQVSNSSLIGNHNIDEELDFSDPYLTVSDDTDGLEFDEDEMEREYYTDSEAENDIKDDEENRLLVLRNDLAAWTSQFDPSRAAVSSLLQVLRNFGLDLPKDKRTLVRADRNVPCVEKCGGSYLYYSVKSIFNDFLSKHNLGKKELIIKINIDGLPLYKSSPIQLWPILVEVNSAEIYVACLFCGSKKPYPVEDYLEDFIAEIDELLKFGHPYEGNLYQVILKAFLCGTPARSFLKDIVQHTSYNACERCTIKGNYHQNRVTYDEDGEFLERNDRHFKNFSDKDHQKKLSPLAKLQIDMIGDFPLDYMHLICLGVMRRTLEFLKKGPPICRISALQLDLISNKLLSMKDHIPSNFAQKPRSLSELDRWKTTEFRQFVLYTGPIVLKDVLSKEMYEHFLLLHVAVRILLNDVDVERNHYIQYASELLRCYVKNAAKFYGSIYNVYNVHNLIHIADDVINKQCSLNELSCFQFQNYLQSLKRKIRNGSNPIAQIVKKINIALSLPQPPNQPSGKYRMIVSTKEKDRYLYLKSNEIAVVKSINQESYECDIIKTARLKSFFKVPCDSKKFGIFSMPVTYDSLKRTVTSDDIEQKAMCLPYDDTSYIIYPLLNCYY